MRIFLLTFLFIVDAYSQSITLNLKQAVQLALDNNIQSKISKYNLKIAQAQYQQALSANYPSVDAILYANRDDKDTIYQQRGVFTMSPEMTKTFALANTLTISDPTQRAFAQNQINSMPTSAFPAGTMSADIDTIAKGRDTVRGQIEFNYPLYTGGKISSAIEQARLNKYIKNQAIIRSDSNIIFDVKKYFYGYMLTDELEKLINSVYKNMKFSRDLTKEFLNTKSDLKIKQTDYLNIKLLTSLIEASLEKIRLNKQMLKNAIGSLVGLKYDDKIELIYDEQKILKQDSTLQSLIQKANRLNPDINSINLALKVKEQKIKEAKSGNYPIVNAFGNISHTYNSYEYGYLNEDDENRWSIGLVIKLPLFNGFKTTNEIIQAKIEKKVTQEQNILLKDMVALQLKNEFLKSAYGYKQIKSLKEAANSAYENSKINFKGYQYEMVQASDLIQSQIMEVFVKTQYLQTVHDYLISLAKIDNLIGQKIDGKI